MAKMTMVQALNLALKQEMEKDDRVIVLGEDVGRGQERAHELIGPELAPVHGPTGGRRLRRWSRSGVTIR